MRSAATRSANVRPGASRSSGRQANRTRILRPLEPSQQECQRFAGRGVEPLGIVDPEEARDRSVEQRRQPVGDGRDQPGVGAGSTRSRPPSRARIDGRKQAGQFSPGGGTQPRHALPGIGPPEPGPEQVDDGTVRDLPLGRIGGRGQDRPAGDTDEGCRLLTDPGLADPGLADEDEEPARSVPHGVVRIPQCVHGLGPTDEREDGDRHRVGWGGDDALRRAQGDDGVVTIADGLVAGGRGGQRGDAEFTFQGGDTGPVLAKRTGPVAGGIQEIHQSDMTPFVERIQVRPTRRRADRRRQVSIPLGGDREPVQDRQDGAVGGHGAGGPPIVELEAVAQGEAGQEVATGQGGRRCECRAVVGGSGSLDLRQVDPDAPAIEIHPRPIDDQGAVADRGTQRGQRPPKCPPRRHVVRVRPEQRRQLIAGEDSALRGEQGQDRHGLASVDREWCAIDQDLGRAEQADIETRAGSALGGHDVTVQTSIPIP